MSECHFCNLNEDGDLYEDCDLGIIDLYCGIADFQAGCYINSGKLHTYLLYGEGLEKCKSDDFDINYCPMCGRKLR